MKRKLLQQALIALALVPSAPVRLALVLWLTCGVPTLLAAEAAGNTTTPASGSSAPSPESQSPSAAVSGAGPEGLIPGNPPEYRVMVFKPEPLQKKPCGIDGWRGAEQRCVDRARLWDGWTLPDNFEDPIVRQRMETSLKALASDYFLVMQDSVARWSPKPVQAGEGIAAGLKNAGVYRPPMPSSSWENWGPSTVNLPSMVLATRNLSQFTILRGAVRSSISLPPAERWLTGSLCQRLLVSLQSGEAESPPDPSAPPTALCSDSFARYFKFRGRAQYRVGHLFDIDRSTLEGPVLEQLYPVHLSSLPPWPSRMLHLPRQPSGTGAENVEARRSFVRSVYDVLLDSYDELFDRLTVAMLRYGPSSFSAVQLRTLGSLALMNSTAPNSGDDFAVRPENAGDLGNTDVILRTPKEKAEVGEDLTDPDWNFAFESLPPGLIDAELRSWIDPPERKGLVDEFKSAPVMADAEAVWASNLPLLRDHLRSRQLNVQLPTSVGRMGERLRALLICHEVFPGEEYSTLRTSCIERGTDLMRRQPGALGLPLVDANGKPFQMPLRLSSPRLASMLPETLRLRAWEPLLQRLDPDDSDGLRLEVYSELLNFLMIRTRPYELRAELIRLMGEPTTLEPLQVGQVVQNEQVRTVIRQLLHSWQWLWNDRLPSDYSELPPPDLGFRVTRRLTDVMVGWFNQVEEVERPRWLTLSTEMDDALSAWNKAVGARVDAEGRLTGMTSPEARRRAARAWNILFRYTSATNPRLPEEWPTALYPEELDLLGLDPHREGYTLRRTDLYSRIIPVIQDEVVGAFVTPLSRLEASEQRRQIAFLRHTVFEILVQELWGYRWDTSYPPLAHRENRLRASRIFEHLMMAPDDLTEFNDLEGCMEVNKQSSGWDRWNCEVEVLAKSRDVPRTTWPRYRGAFHLALLKAWTATLTPSGQRIYRRWIFQRHGIATLDNVVQGTRTWKAGALEDAVQQKWEQFLTGHGLHGRREDPPELPSVNPLAVCASPTATPEQRLAETSIKQVVIDVLFEGPDDPGLDPAAVLWEARKNIPFLAIDGSSRRFSSRPDPTPNEGLQIEPLFRIPALTTQGDAAFRMVYRARWRVWSGWHLFWNVSDKSGVWRPVLRTGAICKDTVLIQADLEGTLLRWALLKDAAPTRPMKVGLDYSLEEEQALRDKMELDRLERLAASKAEAETGTKQALEYRVEDRIIGAREGRTDRELVQMGYASVTPRQAELRDQLRTHLADWFLANPQPVRAGVQNVPTMLMAFDISYLPKCRKLEETGLQFYFRRTPYLRDKKGLFFDPDFCEVDVAGWSWAVAKQKGETVYTHLAPDYLPPPNPMLPPSSLIWRPRSLREWSFFGGVGGAVRNVYGIEHNQDPDLVDTLGSTLSAGEFAYRAFPIDLSAGAHLTWWLSERSRLGFELGSMTRLELLYRSSLETLVDPLGVPPGETVNATQIVKPSLGVSVGVRRAPPPPLSYSRDAILYPWASTGTERTATGLLRNQFGLRGRMLVSTSFGELETSLGGEVWYTWARPWQRGLLAAFTPYIPRAMMGLHLSADRAWHPLAGEPPEGFYAELDRVWTFSLGLRGQLNLVNLKLN